MRSKKKFWDSWMPIAISYLIVSFSLSAYIYFAQHGKDEGLIRGCIISFIEVCVPAGILTIFVCGLWSWIIDRKNHSGDAR